jgi:acetyl esterase/lipase
VVDFPGQKDLYRLSKTDGDRTVFAQERDGKVITSSQARPPRPLIQARGRTFDTYADRYTRYAKRVPELLVDQPVTVSFCQPQLGTEIRYTLDGSEPSRESACYLAPLTIAASAQFRARTFVRDWPFGPDSSETVAANFRSVTREPNEMVKSTAPTNGLVLKVYEVVTVPYNEKGFFDAGKSMLPKLSDEKAVSVHRVDAFQLPPVNPSTPQREQRKAFFAFAGYFKAPADGIYEFSVDSCGPVTLDVGKQTAIEETGQYHQNQKVRRGEVALAAGWHTIALTVCDPIFWKVNMDGPMPLSVTFKVNGGKEQEIATGQLLCDAGREALSPPIKISQHDPVSLLVEPGLELACYDRKEKERDDDYLDIEGLTPYATENRADLAPNANGNVVHVYNGYFFAPTDGLYTFDAPARTFDSYDRNQIRIGSEVVVQRGVPGRNPLRQVILKAGYHPVSFRLGSSRSDFTVYYPNSTNGVQLTASGLYRPVRVAIVPEGRQEPQRFYEIFKPTLYTMNVPPAAGKLEIRYTLDGQTPTASSATFEKPIEIDQSVTLKALAFKEGKPVTPISSVRCERVSIPQAALLGYWDFKTIGKDTASPVCGKVVARIAGAASVTDDSGPALQLSGNKMGLQLVNLGMVENALSVSLWLKMEVPGVTLLTDGKYRQVLGASYFGKGYSIRGGGRAGICKSNEWQHVVFTWNGDDTAIHVDGVEVNRQKYAAQLHSDSLDMMMGYKGLLRSLRVYNKSLSAAEVSQIYTVEGAKKLTCIDPDGLDDDRWQPDQRVSYKRVDGLDLPMALFLPKDRSSLKERRPAVVCIHGGGWSGWRGGDWQTWEGGILVSHARYFSARGAVGVIISYRHVPRPDKEKAAFEKGPSLFELYADCRSAVRYLRQHADQFGIDPRRIAVIGDSAGGHLAACLGTIDRFDEPGEDQSVSAMANLTIPCNPITDLLDPKWLDYVPETPRAWEGDQPLSQEDRAKAISPLWNVTPASAPSLLLHGLADRVVMPSHSADLQKRMQQSGVRCEQFTLPEASHAFILFGYKSTGKEFLASLRAADRFLVSAGYLSNEVSFSCSRPGGEVTRIPCDRLVSGALPGSQNVALMAALSKDESVSTVEIVEDAQRGRVLKVGKGRGGLVLTGHPSLGTASTVSLWLMPQETTGVIVRRHATWGNATGFTLSMEKKGTITLNVAGVTLVAAAPAAKTWSHVSFSIGPDRAVLSLNGKPVAEKPLEGVVLLGPRLRLAENYAGLISDVQIL